MTLTQEWIGLFRHAPRTVAAALFLAIVLVPVWSTGIPPLLDYHNHLARQYVLAGLPHSETLQAYYEANWRASPYLAFDAIVQGLATFLPVAVAGKVFLSVMLLLLAAAPMALNAVLFGRVTPMALLGLLFIHNTTTLLGFVNNVFGIGFALCLLALWIRMRTSATAARLAIFPLLATLLFFSHLFGLVIYGLCAASYELGRHVALVRARRPARLLSLTSDQWIGLSSLFLQLVLPLTLFLLFGPTTEALGSSTYGGLQRKIELVLGSVLYLMRPYAWQWDTALSVLLPLLIVGLLAVRKVMFATAMAWPMVALVMLFVAMPVELFTWGWGADHRLLPAIGLMFVGSLGVRSEQLRLERILWLTVFGLVAIRVVAVTLEWRGADAEYSAYLRAFDVVDDGSKVFVAFGEPFEKQVRRRPYQHMPTLVLMKKQVYVPYLFADRSGVFPLRYTPEGERLDAIAKGEVKGRDHLPRWGEVVANFDYVLLVDQELIDEPVVRQLVPVFNEGRISVYKTADR